MSDVRRRDLPVAAAGHLLLALVFFAPALLSGRILVPGDTLHAVYPWGAYLPQHPSHNSELNDVVQQFYPWFLVFRERLLSGELPLWNPDSALGPPAAAPPPPHLRAQRRRAAVLPLVPRLPREAPLRGAAALEPRLGARASTRRERADGLLVPAEPPRAPARDPRLEPPSRRAPRPRRQRSLLPPDGAGRPAALVGSRLRRVGVLAPLRPLPADVDRERQRPPAVARRGGRPPRTPSRSAPGRRLRRGAGPRASRGAARSRALRRTDGRPFRAPRRGARGRTHLRVAPRGRRRGHARGWRPARPVPRLSLAQPRAPRTRGGPPAPPPPSPP